MDIAEWDPRAPGGEAFHALERDDADGVRELRELLARGADIEAPDPRSRYFDGQTLLIAAAGRGRADLVRLLLALGADVDARSASGWTALMRACNGGDLECSRLLLDAGADPELRNDEGYTAYGRIPGTRVELLRLLRERGARDPRPGRAGPPPGGA
ncbi:ankyrin repeat domain-containing protein [Embleya sp. NBC_00896]|uniref:ankyrin repeat domain-containing protein n=1 Tax=Embleya sp. NBC_00896 TaxID=2975961 RepID=UPI002F910849|nr:ankyrin repeat domain-containing protein [Embleya sp. NBC_00896]